MSDALQDLARVQYAVQVWGDSGLPEIRNGDYLVVNEDQGFRYTGFYVLVRRPDGLEVVKILDEVAGQLMLRSNNPDFAPVPVGDGYEMIGYAIGWKREIGQGSYMEVGVRSGLRPGFLLGSP